MRPFLVPVVVAALMASNAFAAENFRPIKVSANDCQLTIINTDSGESYQPNLQPQTRHVGGNFIGTKYLSEWKNEYPRRDRMVFVEPFLGDQGNILVMVHAGWKELENGDAESLEKKVQVTYVQSGSEFALKTIEQRERSNAKTYATIRDERNQYKEESLKRSDVKAGENLLISYNSSTGLAIQGSCKFSRETDGDESLPLGN